MDITKHEIYFSRKDFRRIRQQFEEAANKKYTSKQLLITAKAYFVEQSYKKCLDILHKIEHFNDPKVLFQRQALLFKATYLQNSPQRNQCLEDILSLFERERKKMPSIKFERYHLQVFAEFREFFEALKENQQRQLVIQNSIDEPKELKAYRIEVKTKQKQFEREPKFEGFPCFLVSNQWRRKQQEHMYDTRKEHPGPITNFSIINHIYEIIAFEEKAKEYLNIVLFPGEEYEVVTKKHWLYLMNIYSGLSVKRVYVSAEKFTSEVRYGDSTIVKLCILYKNEIGIIQTPTHSLWPNGVIPYLCQKYGTGQLKEQVSENNFILVGDGRVFQPEKERPLVYITFSQNNIHNLSASDKKYRNRLFYRYDFEKYAFKESSSTMGLMGLANDKFNCYMNSSIQCLSNTNPLTQAFITNDYVEYIDFSKRNKQGSRGEVACAFADLIKKLWTYQSKANKSAGVDPKIFKDAFSRRFELFSQDDQQDAHQFLNFLLNCLHDDLNQESIESPTKLKITKDTTNFECVRRNFIENYEHNHNSMITELFRSFCYSSVECLSCKSQYYTFDVQLTIPIPLPPDNPYVNIFFVSSETPEQQATKLRVYINELVTVFELIQTVRKKKQSKDKILFYLFSINKKNFRFEEHLRDETEINRLLLLQNKFHLFLYEVENPHHGKKISDIEANDEKIALTLIQYKYNDYRRGFPRLVMVNVKSTSSERDRIGYESLCDQALNISGGLATEKQKKEVVEKTKLETVKGKPYECVLKVYLKKKLYLFKENGKTQDIGEIRKDVLFDLQTCLNLYSEKQKLTLEDKWSCQHCKKTSPAQTQSRLYSVGSHVIIVLKRFKEGEKIQTKIDYPLENLDMRPYFDQKTADQFQILKTPDLYDLYGVIIHKGSLNHGHYISYCKNFYTRKWYLYDDEILKEEANLEGTVLNQNAYILFYRKKGLHKQEPSKKQEKLFKMFSLGGNQ